MSRFLKLSLLLSIVAGCWAQQPFFFGAGSAAPIVPHTLITHAGAAVGGTTSFTFPCTTATVCSPSSGTTLNTTGAVAIFIWGSYYTGGSSCAITDSVSNSYTKTGGYTNSTAQVLSYLWYVFNPTTSATHSWTFGGTTCYGSANVLVVGGGTFAGTQDGTPADNILTSAGLSNTVGSVTPSSNGDFCVTGIVTKSGSAGVGMGVASPFTGEDYVYNGSLGVPNMIGYDIQTTATAVNAAWTWSMNSQASTGATWCWQ